MSKDNPDAYNKKDNNKKPKEKGFRFGINVRGDMPLQNAIKISARKVIK